MGCVDKTIRTFDSLDAMKIAEYQEWQGRPAHERMSAVVEITLATYKMKEPTLDVLRLQRTFVHLPRPQR